jgi:hypothetical protein
MFSDDASLLEITWTAIALAGTLLAFALVALVWPSYRTVVGWIDREMAVRWGPRHLFVLGFLVGSGLLAVVWVGFDALGANAMLNPPPVTPDRIASSARAGWILVSLETVLLAFTGVLLLAWVTIGRRTLRPLAEHTPIALMLDAIDAGRELGHLVRNRIGVPIGLIDLAMAEAALTDRQRADLIEARDALLALVEEVGHLHQEIRDLEPKP